MARRVTPEDVHQVAFDKPAFGQRGYLEHEVDAFLDLIEATLAGTADRPVTAADVQNVAFGQAGSFRNRGYSPEQVDAFLDAVHETLEGLRD